MNRLHIRLEYIRIVLAILIIECFPIFIGMMSHPANRRFYFAIALLDQSYWILGSVIGAVAGALIPFSTEGVDFAMTALFVVIALDQWRSYRKHLPAVLGAGVTVLFLIVLGHFFGQDQMLLISLGAIVLCLLVLRDRLDEKEEETC